MHNKFIRIACLAFTFSVASYVASDGATTVTTKDVRASSPFYFLRVENGPYYLVSSKLTPNMLKKISPELKSLSLVFEDKEQGIKYKKFTAIDQSKPMETINNVAKIMYHDLCLNTDFSSSPEYRYRNNDKIETFKKPIKCYVIKKGDHEALLIAPEKNATNHKRYRCQERKQ